VAVVADYRYVADTGLRLFIPQPLFRSLTVGGFVVQVVTYSLVSCSVRSFHAGLFYRIPSLRCGFVCLPIALLRIYRVAFRCYRAFSFVRTLFYAVSLLFLRSTRSCGGFYGCCVVQCSSAFDWDACAWCCGSILPSVALRSDSLLFPDLVGAEI